MSPSETLLHQLLSMGAFADVLAACERIAAERSLKPYENYPRGVALMQKGAHREAVEALASAVEDERCGYWGNYWKGRGHEALGEAAAATRSFRRALSFLETAEIEQAYVAAAFRLFGSKEAAADIRAEEADHLQTFVKMKLAQSSLKSLAAQGDTRQLQSTLRQIEDRQRDLEITVRAKVNGWPDSFLVETEHPVAWETADHTHPRGTLNDNTRSPRFVAACERALARRPLQALDLGCAGGALVRDFLLNGHRACGLEGSDASLRAQRAEWRLMPDHLKTCDITQPFQVRERDGRPARFDVISAWEVLEHIPESALPSFFANVKTHLAAEGLFVASVATFEDQDATTGAVWHVTVQPADWWKVQLDRAGLTTLESPFVAADYARGSGNGLYDWDVVLDPAAGFHLVAAHSG